MMMMMMMMMMMGMGMMLSFEIFFDGVLCGASSGVLFAASFVFSAIPYLTRCLRCLLPPKICVMSSFLVMGGPPITPFNIFINAAKSSGTKSSTGS